jgi:hypothetical protein
MFPFRAVGGMAKMLPQLTTSKTRLKSHVRKGLCRCTLGGLAGLAVAVFPGFRGKPLGPRV